MILFFIFQLENILRSYLRSKFFDFLRVLGKFYLAWRKNFTKILTYRRGSVCPLMSRRCRRPLDVQTG